MAEQETAEATTTVGLEMISTLKQQRDKRYARTAAAAAWRKMLKQHSSKRLIAADFLTLPDKVPHQRRNDEFALTLSQRRLPEYYAFTKMPLALDTIEVGGSTRRRCWRF